ncbi:hypothetical protein HQ584_03640, partial [Patescibacteria group bacterium]|nr:hypothetical protein [Patescibacteria group bacterium]
MIIHIQDAHLNYEAQKNLAHILEELIDKYDLKLILVEGGKGDVGLSHFRKYPKDRRDRIAEKYLRKGLISGEEYLDIISDYPLKIYGIENEKLYQENVKLFFEIENFRKEAEAYLNQIKVKINLLKQRLFNKEELTFDKEKELFSKNGDFQKYISYLKKISKNLNINISAKYPNLNVISNLQALEGKIEFDTARKERDRLIGLLTKILYKQELGELLAKSLEFRTNKLSTSEYYQYLKNLAANAGIIFEDYKKLAQYIKYISIYEQVDPEGVFNEIDLLETEIKNKYFTNKTQKKIDDISCNLSILTDFVNLKLLPHKYARYTNNKSDFSIESWISFINQWLKRYGNEKLKIINTPIDNKLEKLERFYKIVAERDIGFVDNALKTMDESNEDIAILITGGFHTTNLTHLFKEKQISYIVIAPKVNACNPDDNLYSSVLKLKNLSQLRPRATKGTIVAQLIEGELAGKATSIIEHQSLRIPLKSEHSVVAESEAVSQLNETESKAQLTTPKKIFFIARRVLKTACQWFAVCLISIYLIGCATYQIAYRAVHDEGQQFIQDASGVNRAQEDRLIKFKNRRIDLSTYHTWLKQLWMRIGKEYEGIAKGTIPYQLGSNKPVAIGFMHDVRELSRYGYVYENPSLSL